MGLLGWVVYLDSNGNGTLDDGEVRTMTDAKGHYAFTNLVTGLGDLSTYVVREVVQDGYTQTSVNPLPIELTARGEAVKEVNFGNVLTTP